MKIAWTHSVLYNKSNENPQHKRKAYAMNIVQYHHSCEVSSSKICQFFAEFHVSQFLRNYNVYKMCGFAVMTAKRVRGSVSEAVLLPTEEGCVRAYPVWERYVLPFQWTPGYDQHSEGQSHQWRAMTVGTSSSSTTTPCLNATAHESGIADPRLRLCQWHVPESLPYTHVWLERWEYLPAAPPLPAVLFVEAAIVRRVSWHLPVQQWWQACSAS